MRKNVTNAFYAFLLLCCVQPWYGCNVINPHEPTPTYVHIDSFHFIPNTSLYPGKTISHEITTVWAYYNNNLIGEFDLPCTIPVVTTGDSGTLQLAPGIMINGLNSNVTPYPFYTLDTFKLLTQPGKIVNHTPETGFSKGLDIFTIADFSGSVPFQPWAGTIPVTTLSGDPSVFEGFGSGQILLGSAADSAVDSSTFTFPITYGQHAFIEFNYKSDVPFYVGLQSNLSVVSSSPYYLAGINPSSTWRKFYLNVEPFVLNYRGSDYNFYIKASVPEGGSGGRVLIDNIQRVIFK